MTSSLAPTRTQRPALPTPPRLRADRVFSMAGALGFGLGVLDLLLQTTLPYPLANLANSSAVWALCAFALAAVARTTPVRSALAGTILLVVAVQAYYLAAFLVDMADTQAFLKPSTIAWMVFGVAAGVVFGVAGSWLRRDRPWLAAAGLSAAASVFFAEAVVRLLQVHALDDLATSALTCALGTAVLLTAVARPAHLARAAALSVPLTVLGIVGFSVGGF